jgi:nitrite reductase/ring-hydroxylating ferredoxin subunit
VSKLVEVARVARIPSEGGITVQLGDLAIAVFNLKGRMLAIDGACIRCGSMLGSGLVEGHEVICRGCGWRYDLATGQLREVPKLRLDTYEVEVIGLRVMIRSPFG